jgi:NAD dependent epimerase/dehydratase family enzyme
MVVGGAALKRIGFSSGDGQQWTSWVGRDELASIIEFALRTEALTGSVNAVSPNSLRSADFAAVTSQTMGHKAGRSLPVFLVRLFMGEMGEEFMLSSRRIQPTELLAAGYQFRFPELEQAVQHELACMNKEHLSPVMESQP